MSVSVDEGPLLRVERSALEDALREAERRTLSELEVVRGALEDAVKAVMTGDAALADDVVRRAGELERRYADVHDRLLALMARQAPVAGDLRLAIALLHVNDRIERMGAQCVNIAKLCRAIDGGMRPSEEQLDCLAAMARLASEQMAESARVFAERDAEGVRRLREHDVAINESNRRCFSLAVGVGGEEARREVALVVAMMARALERTGDNAVDIGQQAVFAASGRLRSEEIQPER
jgi:phosphate transport system protein